MSRGRSVFWRKRAWSVLVLVAVSLPATGAADGCPFPHVSSAETGVEATGQRAVMWLRDGNWEIHIQPRFERSRGMAAWVVPFPVRPSVQQSSEDFFNQLDLATAPLFVEMCEYPVCGSSGFSSGAYGGAGAANAVADAEVTVWEKGSVGSLDYVILSAATGESLVSWLDAEGYLTLPGSEPLLADLQTEELFFFVSRLSADADPADPIAPLRFILSGLDPPTYPLRMTGLGIAEGQALDLTLWVLLPAGDPLASGPEDGGVEQLPNFRDPEARDRATWMPESHEYRMLSGCYVRDADGFEERLDDLFDETPGVLALLFEDQLDDLGLGMRAVCSDHCIYKTYRELGLETPEQWCDEMQQLAAGAALIYRYQGRLPKSALDVDLTLGLHPVRRSGPCFPGTSGYAIPWQYDWPVTNVYVTDTGFCYSCPDPEPPPASPYEKYPWKGCGCSVPGNAGGSPLPAALVWLPLLLLRRRSSRG